MDEIRTQQVVLFSVGRKLSVVCKIILMDVVTDNWSCLQHSISIICLTFISLPCVLSGSIAGYVVVNAHFSLNVYLFTTVHNKHSDINP